MENTEFQKLILGGIPGRTARGKGQRHGGQSCSGAERCPDFRREKARLKNALRYFDKKQHKVLAPEFAKELKNRGRIYMYRFRPGYDMFARNIQEYPTFPCRRQL